MLTGTLVNSDITYLAQKVAKSQISSKSLSITEVKKCYLVLIYELLKMPIFLECNFYLNFVHSQCFYSRLDLTHNEWKVNDKQPVIHKTLDRKKYQIETIEGFNVPWPNE